MKKISLLFGCPSSEYEVSINTAKSISESIDKDKYNIIFVHISKNSQISFSDISVDDSLENKNLKELWEGLEMLKQTDLCLLATHGEFGEDGTLQTFLEYLNINYTGSDAYSSRLCMDKYRSSIIIKDLMNDLLVPETNLIKVRDLKNQKIRYPCVLKPNKKGSSVGIFIIENDRDRDFAIEKINKDFDRDEEFLIQEAILDSIEISCGCLETKKGEFISIPPIEIKPQLSEFFDYNSKYTMGGSIEVSPPQSISKEVSKRVVNLAQKVHSVLGCSTYSRSDFLVKEGNIYFLEINTLPGMTNTSLLPQECHAVGMNFSEMLEFIIENTNKRKSF